jgi:hypothetical protein
MTTDDEAVQPCWECHGPDGRHFYGCHIGAAQSREPVSEPQPVAPVRGRLYAAYLEQRVEAAEARIRDLEQQLEALFEAAHGAVTYRTEAALDKLDQSGAYRGTARRRERRSEPGEPTLAAYRADC